MAKTKVAVLGGGLGAMAAAYELTCTAELRERFEVTVYQQGWRLGGKGASGRNAEHGQRIEEHGLHAFLGFYENAFALMRDVYDDWGKLRPDARWTSWRDAFTPQYLISLREWVPEEASDPDADGRWATWNLPLPKLPGVPGDHESVPFGQKLVTAIVQLVVEWLKELVKREPKAFFKLAKDLAWLQPSLWKGLAKGDPRAALDSIKGALDAYEEDSSIDDDVRRLVLSVQLASAILRGLLDDVLPRGEVEGLAFIDQWDFKAWLERHGASKHVSFWGPVRALYDLGFAYEGGQPGRENATAAAGVTLRILLLLGLGYKDAPLWKMNAGMGDVIFAPLYYVLKARGVRFELFSRVTELGLSATGNLVDRIEIAQQVALSVPEYDPIVEVKGLPSWPSEPRWEQITGGIALRDALRAKALTLESAWCDQRVGTRTLRLGVDFDRVVLGISIAALPDVAPALIEGRESWKEAMASARTVQTQALQLWLDRDAEGLGWEAGPTIMTGYVEPFDTWGDLSHLAAEEDWPAGGPKSVAYFCNAFPDATTIPPYTDHDFPRREHQRVFESAKAYLENDIGPLWPKATPAGDPSALDWARLYDPSGGAGVERLEAQYWRANIDPTERYVLSPPSSLKHRLWAGRSGYLNLTLAGDWVTTSINAGCAEAAIEGGLRAAHAMIGSAPRPFVDRHIQDDLTLATGD